MTTRLYFLLGCPLTLLVLTGGSACVTEVLEDESIVFSLAHGRDCVFACNVAQPGERGYQRSGEQPSCFAGALTMSHACTPIVDCQGSWTTCTSSCADKEFAVNVASAGGGAECSETAAFLDSNPTLTGDLTAACLVGDGACDGSCTTDSECNLHGTCVDSQCECSDGWVGGFCASAPPCTVTAPTGGTLGDCALDGVLRHGATCSLDCDEGFTLSGTQPSCDGGILTESVVCTPDNCTDISLIPHADWGTCTLNSTDGTIGHGSTCEFDCDEGYVLSGPPITCSAGSASASPACLPTDCADIHPPLNGRPGTCREDGTLGHTASCELACDDGYTISGGDASCLAGALTSAHTTCSQLGPYKPCYGKCIHQDDVCTIPVLLLLGCSNIPWFKTCASGDCVPIGQQCPDTGACSVLPGFVTCAGTDGACVPDRRLCPQPEPEVANSVAIPAICTPDDCTGNFPPCNAVVETCANDGTLAHGDSCTMACENGYTLTGQQPACFAGTVTESVTCTPDHCAGIVAPQNGTLGSCNADGKLLHGTSCELACDDNYTLTGQQPSCRTGVLTSSVVCSENVDCEGSWQDCALDCADKLFIVSVEQSGNGAACPFSNATGAMCEIGDGACRGTCLDDADCGTHGSCIIDGEAECAMVPGFVACEPGACVPAGQRCPQDPNSQVCSCSDGYAAGYCTKALGCTGIVPPVGGSYGDCPVDGSLPHGDSCTMGCNAGSTLSLVAGEPARTSCDAGVALSPGTCLRDDCSGVVPPANGAMGTCSADLAHGASCQLACNAGYSIVGRQPFCSAGTLFGAISCIPNDCDSNLAPTTTLQLPLRLGGGSTLVASAGTCPIDGILRHGESCQMQCKPGFVFDGQQPSCALGVVDSSVACLPSNCAGIQAPDNGGMGDCNADGSLAHNAQCTLECDTGYTAVGEQPLCWAGEVLSTLVCSADGCTGVAPPASGLWGSCAQNGTLRHGQSCELQCDGGYSMSGDQPSCNLGVLTESAVCSPDACEGVSAPSHGSIGDCPTDGVLAHGASCSFDCLPGYTLSGVQPACSAGALTTSVVCEPNDCSGTIAPEFGTLGNCSASGALVHGASCLYECDSGYTLQGHQPTCNAGTLAQSAVCAPNSCTGIVAPEHGGLNTCPRDGYVIDCRIITGFVKCGESCIPSSQQCTGGPLPHGESCQLACNSGYTITDPVVSCAAGTRTTLPQCLEDMDCAGEWSACAADCGDKTYSVTTPQSGGGAACDVPNGRTAACERSDGQCVGACSADSDCNDHGTCTGNVCVCDTGYSGAYCSRQSDCSGIAAPANGGMGDCPLSGTLAHGESCSLHCSTGYTISGDQPSCTQGTLSAAPTCAPDIDCAGSWSTCLVDCADKVFTVTTAQSGSGNPCEAADGGTMACERGAGACVGDCLTDSRCNHGTCTNQICQCDSGYSGAYCASPDGCTGISAPAHGGHGSCASDGSLAHGQTCSHACDAGYTLTGAQQPLCTAGVVATDITCEPSSCVGVTAPTDGNLGNCASDGTLAHGASCALSCESGYTPAGDQPSCTTGTLTSSVVCVADVDCAGEWSACAADCGDKTYSVTTPQSGGGAACDVPNGRTAACERSDGQCVGACSADSDCNDHGTCTGNVCVCDTGWDGGVCTRPQNCVGIAAPASGGFGTCLADGSLAHGLSCEFECDQGYSLTGSQPSCDAGTVTESVACEPQPCTIAEPAHGSWGDCPTNGQLSHSESCTFDCDEGFELLQQPACNAGDAGPGLPCTPKGCTAADIAQLLPSYTDGTVPSQGLGSCASGIAHGGTCTLACNAGYMLSGAQPTCSIGVPSADALCTPMPCTTLNLPAHGTRGDCPNSIAHLGTCNLGCESGYSIANPFLQCNAGSVSITTAMCNPDDCVAGQLVAPEFATLGSDCPADGSLPHDASCDLVCDEGYTLTGDQPRCFAGQILTSASCVPSDCSGIVAPGLNGGLGDCPSDGTLVHNATCELECNSGYTAVGNQPECSLGVLTSAVECVPNDCTGLQLAENGRWGDCNSNGTMLHDERCDLACVDGYTRSGPQAMCAAGLIFDAVAGTPFAGVTCIEDIDCVGKWSKCSTSCADKTFTILTPVSGSGEDCEAADGASVPCYSGDGDCADTCWSDHDCNGQGTCGQDSRLCVCAGDYWGMHCQNAPVPCGGCGEHGTCPGSLLADVCDCTDGYTNGPAGSCEVDPCGGCGEHGTCPAGQTTCSCSGGYTGSSCETPPDLDCSGHWTACGSDCGDRTFVVDTPQSGNGEPCAHTAGDSLSCSPGVDECPPDADCIGSWSVCTSLCEESSFTVLQNRTGEGQACETHHGAKRVCSPGDGDCPADISCLGTWSQCEPTCEDTVFSVAVNQSGQGHHCEATHLDSAHCSLGDGSCGLFAAPSDTSTMCFGVDQQWRGPALAWSTYRDTVAGGYLVNTQRSDVMEACDVWYNTTVADHCPGIWELNISSVADWQCTVPCARRVLVFATGCAATFFTEMRRQLAEDTRDYMSGFLSQATAYADEGNVGALGILNVDGWTDELRLSYTGAYADVSATQSQIVEECVSVSIPDPVNLTAMYPEIPLYEDVVALIHRARGRPDPDNLDNCQYRLFEAVPSVCLGIEQISTQTANSWTCSKACSSQFIQGREYCKTTLIDKFYIPVAEIAKGGLDTKVEEWEGYAALGAVSQSEPDLYGSIPQDDHNLIAQDIEGWYNWWWATTRGQIMEVDTALSTMEAKCRQTVARADELREQALSGEGEEAPSGMLARATIAGPPVDPTEMLRQLEIQHGVGNAVIKSFRQEASVGMSVPGAVEDFDAATSKGQAARYMIRQGTALPLDAFEQNVTILGIGPAQARRRRLQDDAGVSVNVSIATDTDVSAGLEGANFSSDFSAAYVEAASTVPDSIPVSFVDMALLRSQASSVNDYELAITLGVDLASAYPSDDADAQAAFRTTAEADIAQLCGVAGSRISVTEVQSGSAILIFEIVDASPLPGASTASEAAQILQTAVAGGVAEVAGVTLSETAVEVRSTGGITTTAPEYTTEVVLEVVVPNGMLPDDAEELVNQNAILGLLLSSGVDISGVTVTAAVEEVVPVVDLVVEVQVTLDVTMAEVDANRGLFETQCKGDIAAALDVETSAITITAITAGSVVVSFTVVGVTQTAVTQGLTGATLGGYAVTDLVAGTELAAAVDSSDLVSNTITAAELAGLASARDVSEMVDDVVVLDVEFVVGLIVAGSVVVLVGLYICLFTIGRHRSKLWAQQMAQVVPTGPGAAKAQQALEDWRRRMDEERKQTPPREPTPEPDESVGLTRTQMLLANMSDEQIEIAQQTFAMFDADGS